MTRASASRATRIRSGLRLSVLLALVSVAGTTMLRAQETQLPADPQPAGEAVPPPGQAPEGEEKIEFPDAPDPGAAPQPAPKTRSPGTQPPTAPADQTAPAGVDGQADEEEPPPDAAPRTPGVVGSTPGHFEPTEKVRADFDVSFPVDI